MVVLTMSCVSILFSVYILSIHHQRGKPLKCPHVVKFITFSIIAPALCLKLRSSGHVSVNERKGREKRPKKDKSFQDNQEVINLVGLSESCPLQEEYGAVLNADSNLNDIDPILKHYKEKESSVNDLIHWLHSKQKSECIEDISFQEWRDVAFVLDRLLFVVFLLITVLSTALILNLRPDHTLTGFTQINH